MFRILLDNIDRREREEYAKLRPKPQAPEPEPAKPEPIPEPPKPEQPPPVIQPTPDQPKKKGRGRPRKTTIVEPVKVEPVKVEQVVEPVEVKPKQSEKSKVNRELILDRLSRMKAPKRDEILATVEDLSKQEPQQIKEEIKKTRGRLKVLKSAEELLKHDSDNEIEDETQIENPSQ